MSAVRQTSSPESESPTAPVSSSGQEAQTGATPTDITELRKEIDYLDSEILRLVKRRVEVSKTIGAARMAAGGPKIVHSREMDVLARYRELGPDGREMAMALLRLGRGRLGR
ncbi:chorismate mutase [Goodfellowiella coeruleoviolacea]|uniref:Chorismate mutase n=1 Tax=Goodfellowiella coeruleoviolacea TaxID=334858 RepID=A0AAE3GDG8_9PSEU|nr:chorismate mutase [Goodfellowiella coeruleoviolacea]MCP2165738.1 chorismate mutase [Goodfellowiella coeruleoviolacea]